MVNTTAYYVYYKHKSRGSSRAHKETNVLQKALFGKIMLSQLKSKPFCTGHAGLGLISGCSHVLNSRINRQRW